MSLTILKKVPDKKKVDSKTAKKKVEDKKKGDSETVEKKAPDKKKIGSETVKKKAPDEKKIDGETVKKKAPDKKKIGSETVEKKVEDKKKIDDETVQKKVAVKKKVAKKAVKKETTAKKEVLDPVKNEILKAIEIYAEIFYLEEAIVKAKLDLNKYLQVYKNDSEICSKLEENKIHCRLLVRGAMLENVNNATAQMAMLKFLSNSEDRRILMSTDGDEPVDAEVKKVFYELRSKIFKKHSNH